MERVIGIEEVMGSWQDIPTADATSKDDVMMSGEEAFLRTKKLLDDAANATEALFDEDGDVSRRYQRIQAREAALGLGMGNNMSENKQSFPPHPLFTTSVFHGFLPASTADDADGANIDGTGLAAASRVANQDPIERRPEERLFCEAFLELRELLQTLAPGEPVLPNDIRPFVLRVNSIVEDARTASEESMLRLRELHGPGTSAVAIASRVTHELSLEKDTWELVSLITAADSLENDFIEARREARRTTGEDPNCPVDPEEPLHPVASDGEVVHTLWNREKLYRRVDVVIEWLQSIASHRLQDSSGALGGGGGGQIGRRGKNEFAWRHTLASIAAGGGQKSNVAEMHPDASLRKLRDRDGGGVKVIRLVDQDDLDEEELVRTMWQLVRAGRVKDAKLLCMEARQPWRAAAMNGGVVGSRREDYGTEDGAVYAPGQGLWQDMCWKMSVSLEQGAEHSEGPARSVAKHESALFAHLAGNTDLLLASEYMQTWEDQVWVRLCSLMNRLTLRERIRHRHTQATCSSLFPGVSSLSMDEDLLERMERTSPPSTINAVFGSLDSSPNLRVRDEGRSAYRQAQIALIPAGNGVGSFLRDVLRHAIHGNGSVDSRSSREDGDLMVCDRARMDPEEPTPEPVLPWHPLRSPQELRFAAHIALVMTAQFPYLTRADDTQEAVDDIVSAYTQHLAETQQVSLVAAYASILPVGRRRELYARFLRGVEGDANRCEALAKARQHIPDDVPAILKKVFQGIRDSTRSVGPAAPTKVPEGDLKKIQALSWLLDNPETRVEAVLQANALARHLVLQEYKESQFPGGGSEREMLCLPWNAPPGTDNAADEPTIVLTARLEAVEILLRTVPLARLPGHAEEKANCDEEKKGEHEAGGSRKKFGSVVVDEDSVEEQHCWRLLLGARQAYTGWASVHRAKEQQQQRWSSQRSSTREQLARLSMEADDGSVEDDAETVRVAAVRALDSIEQVLTYEGGWMNPQHFVSSTSSTPSSYGTTTMFYQQEPPSREQFDARVATSSHGALGIMDNLRNDQGTPQAMTLIGDGGGAPTEMFISDPLGEEVKEDEEVVSKRRRAAETAEAARQRVSRELERVKREEEGALRLGEISKKEELQKVREACLPALVFLLHKVLYSTGLWMLQWSTPDFARPWFVRAQEITITVCDDLHGILPAMNRGHVRRLLQCAERSSTKILECDERIRQ